MTSSTYKIAVFLPLDLQYFFVLYAFWKNKSIFMQQNETIKA